MKIGGIEPCSLIDFPGKVAAVFFTQGCNFRCRYCHNPSLVYPSLFSTPIPPSTILLFLEQRKHQLDGIVLSGGEPTLQPDLFEWVSIIKNRGFLVKLDTNGSFPDVLEQLLQHHLLDYIAMDIKAPLTHYPLFSPPSFDIQSIPFSIGLIEQSGVPHVFRTTYDTGLLTREDLTNIQAMISSPLLIQPCNPPKEKTFVF